MLIREIQRNGFRVLRASSDGPDYPAELGFLVLDIGTNGICGFGREYRQNAVLAGRRGAKARLVWCGGLRQRQQTLEK